jgi:hypothetical protein
MHRHLTDWVDRVPEGTAPEAIRPVPNDVLIQNNLCAGICLVTVHPQGYHKVKTHPGVGC